eukprot:2243778-Ditylum_brightwellii.AAC.1
MAASMVAVDVIDTVDDVGGFVDIAHNQIEKMMNKQLIAELQKRGQPKGKFRKADLQLWMKQTLAAGIAVLPSKEQEKSQKERAS